MCRPFFRARPRSRLQTRSKFFKSRMDRQPLLPNVFPLIRQSGACAQHRKLQCRQTASLLERLSVSKFPRRHPILYGLAFEFRTFYHRIQLLGRRGCTRPLEIGPVFEEASPGCLVHNKRTQARSRDIQKLLADSPYLSFEDCHLFLLGWDAGEEWRTTSAPCTEESSFDKQRRAHSSGTPCAATEP